MFSPMEIAAVVGVAILIFGADKLPKLAKSAGQAKKEFMIGQAEADVAAEQAREEARKAALEVADRQSWLYRLERRHRAKQR